MKVFGRGTRSRATKRGKKRYWIFLALPFVVCLLIIALPFMDRLTLQDREAKKTAYLQKGHEYFAAAKYHEAAITWKKALQLGSTLSGNCKYLS